MKSHEESSMTLVALNFQQDSDGKSNSCSVGGLIRTTTVIASSCDVSLAEKAKEAIIGLLKRAFWG